MVTISRMAVVVATMGFTLSGTGFANSAGNAENLKNGMQHAKQVVDNAIAATGASQPGGTLPGGQPGGFPPSGQPGGWPPSGQPGGFPPSGQPGGWPPSGQPGGFPPTGQPGGWPDGHNPWFVSEDALSDLLESDQLGLPIMIQASGTLAQAMSAADHAKQAFISSDFQLGNYRYAQACNFMGIARSQIGRANTAALQPPQGYLSAWGPDLTQTVVELNTLKATEGCP